MASQNSVSLHCHIQPGAETPADQVGVVKPPQKGPRDSTRADKTKSAAADPGLEWVLRVIPIVCCTLLGYLADMPLAGLLAGMTTALALNWLWNESG